jgi:hypothetical protein
MVRFHLNTFISPRQYAHMVKAHVGNACVANARAAFATLKENREGGDARA